MLSSQSPKRKGPPKKEPGAPTGIRSAFLYFANNLREAIKKEHPDWPHTQIGKELGIRWKSSTEEERAPFLAEEVEDRKRHAKEMAEFNAKKAADGGKAVQIQNQNKAPMRSPEKNGGVVVQSQNQSTKVPMRSLDPITALAVPTTTTTTTTFTSVAAKVAVAPNKGPPKGPRSAFYYFANKALREDIMKEHPDWPHTEVTKEIGNRWKSMSVQDKVPFEAESKEDKARHTRELAEYNALKKAGSAKRPTPTHMLIPKDMEYDGLSDSESESGSQMEVVPKASKAKLQQSCCCVCAKSTSPNSGTADKVLLCDKKLANGSYCTNETHMYCLNPPLTKIPKGDFFCPLCRSKGGSSKAKAPMLELVSGNGNEKESSTAIEGLPAYMPNKPDNTSLVPNQVYCRYIYECRFTISMVFFLLLKKYKGDIGFELLYTPLWLEEHFKELLGGTLPCMPFYTNTLIMDNADTTSSPRMAIDGDQLYSVARGSGKTLAITKWDAKTDTQVRIAQPPLSESLTANQEDFSEVRSLCVHAGKIFIGFGNGNIRVCRTSDFGYSATIEVFKGGYLNAVSCLTASNGQLFAGGGGDGIITVFDTTSYARTTILKGHTSMVFSLTVNDGILYSGSFDKTIKKWNCKTLKLLHTLKGATSSLMSLTIYNGQLIAGCSDGDVHIWRIQNDSDRVTLSGLAAANALCLHNNLLYTISSNGHNIYVFDLKSGRYIGSMRHPERLSCLSIYGGKLFSAHEGGDIKVLECEKEALSAPFGDPKVTLLPLKDLKARIIERKFAMGGGNLMLPMGKEGGYSNVDIDCFNSRGPGSELVRMYNHHVRATCSLSDRERRAPFFHNILFTDETKRAKTNEVVAVAVVPGRSSSNQLNGNASTSASRKKKKSSNPSPPAPYLANLPPLPSLASLPSLSHLPSIVNAQSSSSVGSTNGNGQRNGPSSVFQTVAPTISMDQMVGWENTPVGTNGRGDPLTELLGDLLAVGKKNAAEITALRTENERLKEQSEKMQKEIEYIKREL